MEIREFLTKVAGIRVARQSGDEISCYCPWHDDNNASLQINYVTGQWNDFGGCTKGSGGLQGFFRKLDNTGSLSQRLTLQTIKLLMMVTPLKICLWHSITII